MGARKCQFCTPNAMLLLFYVQSSRSWSVHRDSLDPLVLGVGSLIKSQALDLLALRSYMMGVPLLNFKVLRR